MKKLVIGATLAALAVGCKSVYKNDGGDADLRPTIVRDIAYEKYDIKSTPVESTDSRISILGFIDIGDTPDHYADNAPDGSYLVGIQSGTFSFGGGILAKAKNAAYANACKAANCDTLVGTRYEIDVANNFLWEEVTVKVVGYPAKLTGVEFHKANLDCHCGKK